MVGHADAFDEHLGEYWNRRALKSKEYDENCL